ncbi:MAG: hypothetical protein M3Q03_11520 [Chloroflexota bacterium]|nr:hypothetical protein [Chloroflexota bacterium]
MEHLEVWSLVVGILAAGLTLARTGRSRPTAAREIIRGESMPHRVERTTWR